MAGYAKIWTSIFNDPWFIGLSSTSRGVWLQLLVWAKMVGDTGSVSGRSWASIGSAWGCDGKTCGKILRKFHEDGKISLTKESGNGIAITIHNYQFYQSVTAKNLATGKRPKRGKFPENSRKIPLQPDQTRADQTRADQTTPSKLDNIPYQEIIGHLNQITGRAKTKHEFKPTAEATKKAIRGRISEGATVDDFYHVHTVKAAEWLNTDMEKHLNPDTLYRPSKFEKYRCQKVQIERGYLPERTVNNLKAGVEYLRRQGIAEPGQTEIRGDPQQAGPGLPEGSDS